MLHYIVVASAVLVVASIWGVLAMGTAMCFDPYHPEGAPLGSSWGVKLADRWEYRLKPVASFVTARTIVSRYLVLQIVLRIIWLTAGAPVKWVLYTLLMVISYNLAGTVALIRGIALRIRYLLTDTEEPDDQEDYTGDWTVIWRIQASGRTPEEAVAEAYGVFRDPGEALMFEAVKGISKPVYGTKFVDMYNTEEDPCEE